MVQDSKTYSPPSPDAELPPSYDSAITLSTAGPSTVSTENRHPPKQITHLFSGPPNAEPLLGRALVPASFITGMECFERGSGIVSHDPKLTDPDVLYDFLRAHAVVHPSVKLHCTGIHFETPERDEVVQDRDGHRHRRKGHPERIIDFDLTIDMSRVFIHSENLSNVHLFALADNIPVLRGTFKPSPPGGSEFDEFASWRDERGLPRWTDIRGCQAFWETRGKGKTIALGDEAESDEALLGTHEEAGLREWCERYCGDPGLLKEFRMRKAIWGWDFSALTAAVKGAITSTGYTSNHIEVNVEIDEPDVIVRPPNHLSRALDITLIYVILWLTLLYPVIWLWQRLHALGGASYDLARASYAMKFYPPLPATFPDETIQAAQERLPGLFKIHPEIPAGATLQPGPNGVHYLLGRKEGEWFREWEERIRMGVRMRYRGVLEGGDEEDAGVGLDGY